MHQTAAAVKALAPDVFNVYIYGSVGHKVPSGVNVITEDLTRSHGLFDQRNELNSQAIIITSYHVLGSRHGPNKNRAYLKKNSVKQSKAVKRKFTKLTDPADPEWNAPHDLSGLIDEMILDEAQNSKGMLILYTDPFAPLKGRGGDFL
jgi:hypothetical protein